MTKCKKCKSTMINFSTGDFIRVLCPKCKMLLRGYSGLTVWRDTKQTEILLRYTKERTNLVGVNKEYSKLDIDGNRIVKNDPFYRERYRVSERTNPYHA